MKSYLRLMDGDDQCLESPKSHRDDNAFDQFNDGDDDDDDDDNEENAKRSDYWKSQSALLQEVLEHYSSSGMKLRRKVSRFIRYANDEDKKTRSLCICENPKKIECGKCFRRKVVNLLCDEGFNASLRTSTWTDTNSFPGGKHEYLEVISSTQIKKKMVYIIELGFRDEFKMAKACDEYRALTEQLPEIFIGKNEHLNAILRIVCDAAKKSTAEKKMHLGPWRKRSFMQRKWSASQKVKPVDSREERVGFKQGFRFSRVSAVRVA